VTDAPGPADLLAAMPFALTCGIEMGETSAEHVTGSMGSDRYVVESKKATE
jgi:hypothetical protein